jgi:hypothetical protein
MNPGTSSLPVPALAVSPSQLSFPQVAVGTNATKSVTLTNTGTGTLTISSVTASGAGFSVSGLTLPVSLEASQAAQVTVTFAPSAAGPAQGTISLATNASVSPATIGLSGTGATYQLTVSPASLSFGDVTPGQAATLPVLLQNTGSAAVTISSATVIGPAFKVSAPALPFTLPAGGDSNLNVTFSPAASNVYNGSLTVMSDATQSPDVEALSGSGATTVSHSVSLSWTASSSLNIAGYNIYRATVPTGPFAKVNPSLITETSYSDATVQAGTYCYAATSVNSAGEESSYSNTAQVTVL